jgi:ATP-dependent Clp protease adapter protein ClpS
MGRLISWAPTCSAPGVIELPETTDGSTNATGHWVVVVFNNDYNTYDEVISILMIATGCSFDEAHMEAWEIDHLGKSVVHHGDKEECEDVASVVKQIGIRVEVSKE